MNQSVTIVFGGDSSPVVQAIQALGETMTATAKNISSAAEAAEASHAKLETQTLKASSSLEILSNLTGVELPKSMTDLATTSAVLGPALEAAFPVLGAIAFGKAVFDVGKEFYEAFDMGGERARQTAEDIRSAHDALKAWNDSLIVEVDKLEQQKALAEGKPFDAHKLGLDEAIEAADKLNEKLEVFLKSELNTITGMSASTLQSVLAGGSKTTHEQTMIGEHMRWLSEAATIQDKLNESKSYGNSLITRENELLALQHGVLTSGSGSQVEYFDALGKKQTALVYRTIDYTQEINAIREMKASHNIELAAIQNTQVIQSAPPVVQNIPPKNKMGKDPNQELLRNMEVEFDRQKIKFGMSAGDAAAFWEKHVDTFKTAPAELKVVLDNITQYQEENHERLRQIHKKVSDDLQKSNEEDAAELAKMQEIGKGILQAQFIQQEKYAQAHDQVVAAKTEGAIKIEEANVQRQKSLALITALSAARQMQALHNREYQASLEVLDREEKRIQDSNAPDKDSQLEKIKLQRVKLDVQHDIKKGKDQEAIAQALTAPYIQASRLITNSLDQAFNGWLRGSETFSRATQHLWQNMAMGAIESLEKIGQKQLEMWILSTVQHKQQASEDAEVDAKGAAIKGWKAGWDMPFPLNLFMAPALAAEALSGGLQMASFDIGTAYVPRTGVAMIHEGERIFTAADNKALMQMMIGDGKNNSDTLHVNHTVNMNGYSDAHFQRALSRNADHVFGAIQKSARRRGIGA